jgi:hypothetical protein
MGKSAYNYLVGFKEFHMVKLVHGLEAHEILLQDHLTTGGNLHLLTMMRFCYNVKKRREIQNEIMAFHKHPQPTTQRSHLHIEEMWKKMKLQHKYSKVLFVLLEMTLNDDFFKGRIHMNSFKDPPSNEFNKVLKQWISKFVDENPQIGLVHLKLHYRVDPLLELDNLKDVVDNSSRTIDFLNNKSRRTFFVFSTTNSLSEDPNICIIIDWKNVLSNLLSMKVAFKKLVCIWDQKSFNNLVITL